jgi:hypothetical protein
MALMAKNKAKAAEAAAAAAVNHSSATRTATTGGSNSPLSSSSSPAIKKKKSSIHKKRRRRAPKGRTVDMTGGISTLRQLQTKARAKAKIKAVKPSADATVLPTGAIPVVVSTTDAGGESNSSFDTNNTSNKGTQAKSVPGTGAPPAPPPPPTSGNTAGNGAVNPQPNRSQPTSTSIVSAQRTESIPVVAAESAPVSVPAAHAVTPPTTPSTFDNDSTIHEDVEAGVGRRSKKETTTSFRARSCFVYSIIGTLMCLLLAVALLVPLGIIQVPEHWSNKPLPFPTESSPSPSPTIPNVPTTPSIMTGTWTPTLPTPSLLDPSTHDVRFETILDIVIQQYLSVFGNGGNINSNGNTTDKDDVISILMDSNTPEFAALSWLILQDTYIVMDPKNESPITPREEIEQRYALSVFFYATLGETWMNDYEFLSPQPSCDWKRGAEKGGVYCEGEGMTGSTSSATTLILGTCLSYRLFH